MPLLERVGQPIGGSGIPLIGNESWRADEYNVDLSSPQQSVATFDRMQRSDAQVRRSLNNLLYALTSAQWRIDAQKDDKDGEKVAKFVRSVLMPGETYGYSGLTPWRDTLSNSLIATWAGFSVIEKVWGYRASDGKQVYGALEARLPKTIRNWTLAPKGPSRLESVTQQVQLRTGEMKDVTIPAERLIVTSFNRQGDNYWGESILRPAHFNWRRKLDLLKFDAIQKERMGGIFWVQSKEGTSPSLEQIREAKRVLESFRIHEKQGLYFPSVFEFHALFPGGEGGKFIESVEYDDRMIEGSMFSMFQSLGTGDKGALSVGTVQLDFMLLAYQGVAKLIEDTFGEQAIVELVNMNFGERELYPRLACENFLQMKPDRLASVLEPLVKVGLIRIDQPIRVLMREKFALPEEDEATLEPSPAERAEALANAAVKASAREGGEKKPEEKPAEKIEKASRLGQPFWRDAMPHEAHVDWDGTAALLAGEPIRIWHRVVAPARREIAIAIAKHFSSATDLRQARRLAEVPGEAELARAVGDELQGVYGAGRKSVLGDRKRQLLQKADDEDDDDEFNTEPTAKQRKDVDWLAAGFTTVMVGSMVQRAIEAGQVSRDAGRSPERQERDILEALVGSEGLSENVQLANLAGRVARAYTNGRVQQGQAMKTAISSIFYSARMDTNTCDPCWAMDGEELDFDTYESQVPNPECDGLDRCRCEPVFVFREVAA